MRATTRTQQTTRRGAERSAPLFNLALRAVLVVEAARQVARQLNMLRLVLADRHELRLVQQDVGSHQHGVRQQPEADRLARAVGARLVLGRLRT